MTGTKKAFTIPAPLSVFQPWQHDNDIYQQPGFPDSGMGSEQRNVRIAAGAGMAGE